MLSYVSIKQTYPTSDVTMLLNQQFIFCTFANNFATKRVYYSKQPISLFFHALSHETIKNFIANTL